MPGWALRLMNGADCGRGRRQRRQGALRPAARGAPARLLNIGHSEQLPYAQGMNFVAASILSECERGGGADEALAFGLYNRMRCATWAARSFMGGACPRRWRR